MLGMLVRWPPCASTAPEGRKRFPWRRAPRRALMALWGRAVRAAPARGAQTRCCSSGLHTAAARGGRLFKESRGAAVHASC
ncbi:hypothetical protein EYF80_053304 [Liparis tanakae]|uniref:Uncharacterized protein n=1 Tax=Liparis tanakae TaxID=230148 RepID=A0A4Z2F5U0_9TELE|nr:hypothetical protein EYF80_053304 [Liparis tanakae]